MGPILVPPGEKMPSFFDELVNGCKQKQKTVLARSTPLLFLNPICLRTFTALAKFPPIMYIHVMINPNINLFLADDDDDDAGFFEEAISEVPVAKFIRARDGIELMELLGQPNANPDIIFLDINMPRKNGFQCLDDIRAGKKSKELPVVVFSTSSASDVVNRMFNSGANAFIVKPTDFNKWKLLIEKAITTDWKMHKPYLDINNFVLSEK